MLHLLTRPNCLLNRSDLLEDEGRRFIITYYKSDRTVVVREPPKRNSGILGGNFLSRMKVICGAVGMPYSQPSGHMEPLVVAGGQPPVTHIAVFIS